VSSIGPEVRAPIYAVTLLIRWVVALGASVGLIALIYHLGVPAGQPSPEARAQRVARDSSPAIESDTNLALLQTLAPDLAGDSAGGGAGHGDVVPDHACLSAGT
jgi:hypothetical protein